MVLALHNHNPYCITRAMVLALNPTPTLTLALTESWQ